MKEVTETMFYDMAFRVRLYIASKLSEEKRLNDLSERETLILELIGAKGRMSIARIGNFYPKVSNSTISTTITKLWKDKKLVDKKILPENQRITTVNLTEIGMILFREKGPFMFRSALENAMGDASACKKWYLSVIAQMANPCRYGRLLPTGFTGVKSIFLPISKRR